MARPRAPAGQRAQVIRHAWLEYHGGRISWTELARVLRQFRR